MIALKFFLIAIVVLLFSCSVQKQLVSKKIEKDGLEILYGEISREQLFFDFPNWNNNYERYTPSEDAVNTLKKFAGHSLEVEIFLGTWCIDSRREVPRFFKLLDQINIIADQNIRIWAVDREKKLETGLARERDIYRVATFIFFDGKRELGRIIETPDISLEEDLLSILERL